MVSSCEISGHAILVGRGCSASFKSSRFKKLLCSMGTIVDVSKSVKSACLTTTPATDRTENKCIRIVAEGSIVGSTDSKTNLVRSIMRREQKDVQHRYEHTSRQPQRPLFAWLFPPPPSRPTASQVLPLCPRKILRRTLTRPAKF